MIVTVTLNPAVDKTLIIPEFTINAVNRVSQVQLDPGGKGINVSKSVHALNGDTICLGILGGSTGSYILSALEELGLPHDMLLTQQPTRTNTKVVDLLRKTNTDINETGAPVSVEILDMVWSKLSDRVKPGDTVVFAGKNPPGTPDDLLASWTKKLRAAGIRVCLDTVGEPMRLALKECPSVIKLNQEELEELIGRKLTSDDQVLEAAREFTADGVGLVAVSMGADGAMFVTRQEAVRTYSPKVEAVSTVGAGDSMMAAIAYCLERDYDLEQTAKWATAVATATVQVSGSRPAELSKILPTLDQIRIKKI